MSRQLNAFGDVEEFTATTVGPTPDALALKSYHHAFLISTPAVR